MSFSRSRTRRFLLQSLYTRVIAGISASKDAPFFEEPERIDDDYAHILEDAVIKNEGKILSVIYEAAPKYDIKSLPTINALILLISLSEILIVRPDDVPVRVSVDEAIAFSRVDETFQQEKWGVDDEAKTRQENTAKEIKNLVCQAKSITS